MPPIPSCPQAKHNRAGVYENPCVMMALERSLSVTRYGQSPDINIIRAVSDSTNLDIWYRWRYRQTKHLTPLTKLRRHGSKQLDGTLRLSNNTPCRYFNQNSDINLNLIQTYDAGGRISTAALNPTLQFQSQSQYLVGRELYTPSLQATQT